MSFDDLNLAVFGIWYIVFLFSTVAHEAAHGLAAQLGGDPTAYEGGQVTLDPIGHIKRSPLGPYFKSMNNCLPGLFWASSSCQSQM